MPGTSLLTRFRGGDGYVVRVVRAIDGRRIAAVALTTLLVSLGSLVNPSLIDFFSPAEIAIAWLEQLTELAVVAAGMVAVYTLLDEGLPRRLPLRLAVVCALVFASAVGLVCLLYAFYGHGFDHLPSMLRVFAGALPWGLPAVFLALIADVQRRALLADSAAHSAELARAQLGQGEMEQQLAWLQAQIEPHFLFNVLGNVRRLYRTEPQAGADSIASLMRYLRVALPQARSRSGTLGDEIEIARSYLELCRMRMGARLTFSVEVQPALAALPFPPMLLVTLVENAIQHGVGPAGRGEVIVRAKRVGNSLEVEVLDDGAGFGAAASSGSGVGLVNVRRQLASRYSGQGLLVLKAREPRGAIAGISIPVVAGLPTAHHFAEAATA